MRRRSSATRATTRRRSSAGTTATHVGVFGVGDRIFADDNTAIGRARDSGLPARIDDYFAIDTDVATTMREVGYRSTVAAPIFVAGVPGAPSRSRRASRSRRTARRG